MCEQLCAHPGRRLVAISPEHDVIAYGVCGTIDCAGRFRGLRIGVDTHPAEIVAEAGFHEHARGWVEALTRCGQYLVDDARDCAVSRVTRPGTR
jgi:hypothetical protein